MKFKNKKHILLVEDEIPIARRTQRELEKYGYTVQHIDTGEKAVALFNVANEIDLILMDNNLGKGIDGTEAASLILEVRDIPIIFLSNYTEPEMVEKTEKITSYGYVIKSSNLTVLDASIKIAFKLFEAHGKMSVISKLPGENPNPVLRLYRDGSIPFANQASESLLELREEKQCVPADWIQIVENVLSNGTSQVIEVESNEKILSLLFTPITGADYINVYGHDITERRQAEKEIKRKNMELLFLNNIAYKLVQLTHSERIDVFLTKEIMVYSTAEIAVFSLYDPCKCVLITKHIETNQHIIKKAVEFGGEKILNTESPISTEVYAMMVDTIIGVSSTLAEVSFGAIPVSVSKAIQLITGIDRFYAIAHVIDGDLFGTTVLGYKKGKPDPREDLLKSYSYLTSISLKRIRVEKDLIVKEDRFRLLAEYSTDMISRHSLDGSFLYVSPACERLFGYTAEELLGHSFFEFIQPDEILRAKRSLTTTIEQKGPSTAVYRIHCKDGQYVFAETISHCIRDPHSGEIIEIHAETRDITERKLAEDRIKNLLLEKELILKEVHHRVKNNMNVMVSLLRLQSNIQAAPEAQVVLQDAAGRLDSMMVLYEKLYNSENFGKLSLKEYFSSLIEEISDIFPRSVEFEVKVEDIQVDVELLSSLGILLNELITNSMKYAFNSKDSGLITVLASKKGNVITVIYGDNGIGLTESVTFENSTGFGMHLIGMLVKQINGTIRIERNNGTEFIIEFEK